MSFNVTTLLNKARQIVAAGSAASKVLTKVQSALGIAKNPRSRFDSKRYVEQKYNDVLHDIELYLDNSGDFKNPSRYFINPAAVLGLHIGDCVNDWVADGWITFMYLPEGGDTGEESSLGQSKSTATGGMQKAAADNGKTLNSYTFRGDGFDLLRVMIMPKSIQENSDPNAPAININQNDTRWMLSYLFSIYEVEDVNDIPQLQGIATSYMKCLKLKFHDVRYQMIQTTNLEYSTSEPKDPNIKANFNSEIALKQGVLYTGDALRDIFNEALSKPEKGGCEEFAVSQEKWDKGKGEIFYTSPAQFSVLDDVDYIYSQHVGTTEMEGMDEEGFSDMCLLHTDRPKEFGNLEPIVLTTVKSMFEKAGKGKNKPGELQKEHFFITAATKHSNPSNSYKAPMGSAGQDVDLKSNKYGQIISYSFVDMSPATNSNLLCNTPVYSVDIGKREFNIEFKGHDVVSARKAIAKTYISQLYKKGGNEEDLFLPTLHTSKKNTNMFPIFSLNGNNKVLRQRNGFHNLLYTGLFQNACICFKTYGLTWRESGTFIGIDKTEGSADNDYNNKLYGQWFVVKVDHLFEAGAYINIIYAVKLHRYDTLESKFTNII